MYRVMIVEDEMFVRIGMEHSIEWGHYEMEVVATASDGVTAYELYEKVKPHLVITDIKMPKMDGIELITKIREQDKMVKFIILTCMEDFKTAKSALDNAVSFYFVKADMHMMDMEKAVESVFLELQKSNIGANSGNSPRENTSEKIRLYLTANNENPSINDLDFTQFSDVQNEDKCYFIGDIHIHALNSDSSDSTHKRLFKSVIQVLNELLRQKKTGSILFCQSDRVYILYTLNSSKPFQYAYDFSEHIVAMIHSYFNLKSTILVGERFFTINDLKLEYQKVIDDDFILFYCKDSVVKIPHAKRLAYCNDIVISLMDTVVTYYKNNFDSEYSQAFCEYSKMLNEKIITDIYRCKMFFSQWFHLYIALMHLTGEQLKTCQFEVLTKINHSENFDDIITNITDFMKKAKEDEENKQQMSIGLVKAINYINKNLDKALTLPHVAENVNFSAGYLSYMFTNEINMSFSEFILNLRIKTAKNMLSQTDDKLYAIAEATGFNDPGYFNKVFKKSTGVSPSQYRKDKFRKMDKLL